MKKVAFLIGIISIVFYFYSIMEDKKDIVVIEKVSPNHVFFSLENKTKKKPDKSQYSVENLSENFKVVKFYYTAENLSALKDVVEATEYKVLFKGKLVLRFDLLKKIDGSKDVKIIKKEDPSSWSEEFNNLLQ